MRWLRRDQRKQGADQQQAGAAALVKRSVAGGRGAALAVSATLAAAVCGTDSPSPELDAAVLRGEEPFSLSEPCVFRVGNLGADAYWEWVHRPVAGAPRFFRRGWAEACSKTAWWVVPCVWLPVALVVSLAGARHRSCALPRPPPDCAAPVEWSLSGVLLQARAAVLSFPPAAVAWQLAGAAFWQLMEYDIHRCLFHGKFPGYWGRTLHFLFHGTHHKYPQDGLRLVFPPVAGAPVMLSIFAGMVACLGLTRACSFGAGTLSAYVAYDCFHYACHHGGRGAWPRVPVLGALRQRHARHHYHGEHGEGFGVTTLFFDVLFGTLGAPVVDGLRGDGWFSRRLMGAAARAKAA